MAGAKSIFEKIWDAHVVTDLGDGFALMFVDRHIMHDLGARALISLNDRGLSVPYPDLNFATCDHSTATMWNAGEDPHQDKNPYIKNIRDNAPKFGFKFFDVDDPGFGIVHVITPELGIALPGTTFACGDSHTCTIGALGTVAWGIGQTETIHVLATQTSVQRKPTTMRIRLEGTLGPSVTPKDIILYIIGQLGAAGGVGYAIELCGPVIDDLPMEGRFTVCNMAVEMGARFCIIAPDDTTIDYLEGRQYSPKGADWDTAVAEWRALKTDAGATFDTEHVIDVTDMAPQVTWGISPQDVIAIDGNIPSPADAESPERGNAEQAALDYVGLKSGAPIEGTPVDWVFIGSCTNGRISDLRAAAKVAKGRKISGDLTAWVVPGSRNVNNQAVEEGLDKIFIEAGFMWGNPGCSMCGGAGDQFRETMSIGQRAISTTNRNFAGRQGPGSITHLASPEMAVAAAIKGAIADVRKLEN